MERLDNNIQAIRREKGLGAAEFVSRVNKVLTNRFHKAGGSINTTTLSMIEQAHYMPTTFQLNAIADVLGVAVTELYKAETVAFIFDHPTPKAFSGNKGKRPKLGGGGSSHAGEKQIALWMNEQLLAALDEKLTALKYKNRAEWFLACVRALLFGRAVHDAPLIAIRPQGVTPEMSDFNDVGASDVLILLTGNQRHDEEAALRRIRIMYGWASDDAISAQQARLMPPFMTGDSVFCVCHSDGAVVTPDIFGRDEKHIEERGVDYLSLHGDQWWITDMAGREFPVEGKMVYRTGLLASDAMRDEARKWSARE